MLTIESAQENYFAQPHLKTTTRFLAWNVRRKHKKQKLRKNNYIYKK